MAIFASLIRAIFSSIWLATIVFSIPLAFDVGGRHCGLAFSLALSLFYVFHSILRLATPKRSRIRKILVRIVGTVQWLVIPSLLIWSLAKFSVDSGDGGDKSWVERTIKKARVQDETLTAWLFGRGGVLENFSIGSWDMLLRYSVPVCQLAEGFCSLLVIQAAGQMTKWVVNTERLVCETRRSQVNILIVPQWRSLDDMAARPLRLDYLQLRLLPLSHHNLS